MQKTADEMRISDWSSDVCSSDLAAVEQRRQRVALGHALQFGDRDLQYAVLAAQGVAFPAYLAQLVLNGVNGYSGELVDRDPCPPYAIHASSPACPTLRRPHANGYARSAEPRVGKACVSTCRSRWSPYQ